MERSSSVVRSESAARKVGMIPLSRIGGPMPRMALRALPHRSTTERVASPQ